MYKWWHRIYFVCKWLQNSTYNSLWSIQTKCIISLTPGEDAYFREFPSMLANSTVQTYLMAAARRWLCGSLSPPLPLPLLFFHAARWRGFFLTKARRETVHNLSGIPSQSIRQRWHRVPNHLVRKQQRNRERGRKREGKPEERAPRRKLNCTWGANSIRE